MSTPQELTLSPMAEFVEDNTPAAEIRFGVFHRLTGQAFHIDHSIKQFLEAVRLTPINVDELLHLPAEAGQLLDRLVRAHLIVWSVEPDALLRPFLDWRLLVPACNPALVYAESDEQYVVIRLLDGHKCWLPRLDSTPEIAEEPVPKDASRLFDAAVGNASLREILNRYQAEGLSNKSEVTIWNALDWLCAAPRQLIRLAPDGCDVRPSKKPIHYLVQNLIKGATRQSEINQFTFYTEKVVDADWNFDWIEPTIAHSFREPTQALKGQTYGERFCEVVLERAHSKKDLRVLEIGGGTGALAVNFIKNAQKRKELGEIQYTIVDCSKAMLDRQRCEFEKYGISVRLIEQDAQKLDLTEETFDLIFSNEMIADLSVTFDQAVTREHDSSSAKWIQSGLFALLDRIWKHLSSEGVAVLTEYGEIGDVSVPVTHLNHVEYPIAFTEAASYAQRIGFEVSICSLSEFMKVAQDVDMLCGQQERYLCLNQLMKRFQVEISYRTFCRDSFTELYRELIANNKIKGLQFAPLAEGLHFGPDWNQFYALILKKPLHYSPDKVKRS